MIKLAISGKMGSGKSEFYRIAVEMFPNLHFSEEKFACPIYECLHAVQTALGEPYHKDGKLLQMIGSHYREKYGKDYWVKKFFAEKIPDNHIITDLRFPEELDACVENGYTIIRLLRQEELRVVGFGNRDTNHISETALDGYGNHEFDYVINNNGSLELFEGAVYHIISSYRKG